MRNIYIMCGLPGSGKSTWIKKNKTENTMIVSKDDIRSMVYGEYKYIEQDEPYINYISLEIIENLLFNTNYDIIVDETHTTRSKRESIIDLIKEYSQDQKFKINIVWCTEDKNNLKNRMTNDRGYNINTWEDVINSIKKDFEKPEKSELLNEWDEIIIHKLEN